MVFNQTKKTMFTNGQSNTTVGQPIQNFLGQIWHDGANILGLKPGEFMYLKNMEYGYSGSGRYVGTRNGNKLITDIGDSTKSFGGNVFSKDDTSYLVFVDNNGVIQIYDSNGNKNSFTYSGVNVQSYNDSFFYNLVGNETLYFGNTVDGIYKITNSGGVFSRSSVSSSPSKSICYSNVSGRMFSAYGHSVRFSKPQNQAATDTSNLETFDVNADFLVNPTSGKEIYGVKDNGEIVLFWKDTGIWALINANEDPTNWIIPQCDSEVGTLSPQTIDFGKYGNEQGYIFLGSDKTLRFFNGRVVRNSGVLPTLEGGDSKIISYPFQKLLDDIPDNLLSKCKGRFFSRYYILNIVSSTGNDIDTTIVIDTDKLFEMEGTDKPQPFWFLSDDYMCYTDTFVVGSTSLIGLNINGYLCQILSKDQHWDETPVRITPIKNYISLGSNIEYDFAKSILYNIDHDTPSYYNTTTQTYTIHSRSVTAKFYGNDGVANGRASLTTTGIQGQRVVLSFWADHVKGNNPARNYLISDVANGIYVLSNSGSLFIYHKDGVNTSVNRYTLADPVNISNFCVILDGASSKIDFYLNSILQTPTFSSLVPLNSFQLPAQYIYGSTSSGTTLNTAMYDLSIFDYSSLSPKYSDAQIVNYIYNNTFNGGRYEFVSEFQNILPHNMVAIDWSGYQSWQKVSDYEAMLYDAYVNMEVGGMWQTNFVTNSFILGDQIPKFDEGIVKTIYPYSLNTQFYNLNFYGDNYAYANGQVSMNAYQEARGNYFMFGFYGNNVNEWAKIYGIEPRYNVIKSSPMGANN